MLKSKTIDTCKSLSIINKMAVSEARSPTKVKRDKTRGLLSGRISEWPKERTERSIANIVITPDKKDKDVMTYRIEDKF